MDKKKALFGGVVAAAVVAATAAAVAHKKKEDNNSESTDDESFSKKSLTTANEYLNPLKIEPSTPLTSLFMLESLTPSLMTRDSIQQGATTGMSVLAARGVSHVIEKSTDALSGTEDRSLQRRLLIRGGLFAGGLALSQIPKQQNEPLLISGIRSAGSLLEIGSLGGAAYDVSASLDSSISGKQKSIRPMLFGAALFAGLVYRGRSLLEQRRSLIDTVPEDPANKIGPAIGSAFGVVIASRLIASSFRKTKSLLINWFGPGPLKKDVAKATNAAMWATGAVGLYWFGVSKIGQANEKREPAYDKIPNNPNVSGSLESVVSFDELGLQGKRFVHDVLESKKISDVMGEKRVKDPIRTYVGFDHDPFYQTGRVELALDELKRTGAYDRKYLLLVSPTGTGWIDQTMIESAEFLTRGDIASVTVQYGKYPSFLALQKVQLGRRQFRMLLWGIRLQIMQMPKSKRPKVLVFGESLGAWTASDTIMHMGAEGFDHYGIDKALWVGLPQLSKWAKFDRAGVLQGADKAMIRKFDNYDQFSKLTTSERKKLRGTILNHDNDPIALMDGDLMIKQPKWLDPEREHNGRGVPKQMEWIPTITFFQTAIDAANAMRVIPGYFRSHGHDYRADMAYFVHGAFDLPATKAQLEAIDKELQKLELAREKRTKQTA